MPRYSKPLTIGAALATLFLLHLLLNTTTTKQTPVAEAEPLPLTPWQKQQRKQEIEAGRYAPVRNHRRPSLTSSSSKKKVPIDVNSRGYLPLDPKASKHPIEQLIDRAKEQAALIENRISSIQELGDSVEDYENAFTLPPPKGFDEWYAFTQRAYPKSAAAPSLYPLVHNPMLAYLSIPGDIARERIAEARELGGIFTFTFVPDGQGDEGTACQADEGWQPEDWYERGKGMVKVRGDSAWEWRCKWVPELPRAIKHSAFHA